MSMKPAAVAKKFFGVKDGQTVQEFVRELSDFRKENEDSYRECIELAAAELGTTVEWPEPA